MNYTEEQLKKTLAKMLPEKIKCKECINEEDGNHYCYLVWNHPQCFNHGHNLVVLDTEFLHLCNLVEKELNDVEANWYSKLVNYHSDWQERVTALAKVKGIEIA
jgi:hypothetical protein